MSTVRIDTVWLFDKTALDKALDAFLTRQMAAGTPDAGVAAYRLAVTSFLASPEGEKLTFAPPKALA